MRANTRASRQKASSPKQAYAKPRLLRFEELKSATLAICCSGKNDCPLSKHYAPG